jgi:CRP/FNR family transcriptional regulator, cyclic AMP receptor protein
LLSCNSFIKQTSTGLIIAVYFILPSTSKLIIMKQKILIVEDNGPIRENTAELLELYNYAVLSACNGKDALSMASQQTPDLILCDIQMPVMDGYSLLEHVRKTPSLNRSRFIFFSASAEKKEIEAGLQMGADDYIVKPFTGEELLDKIKMYI